MTDMHHYLLRTFAGRAVLIVVLLVLSLLVATAAGWLPAAL